MDLICYNTDIRKLDCKRWESKVTFCLKDRDHTIHIPFVKKQGKADSDIEKKKELLWRDYELWTTFPTYFLFMSDDDGMNCRIKLTVLKAKIELGKNHDDDDDNTVMI